MSKWTDCRVRECRRRPTWERTLRVGLKTDIRGTECVDLFTYHMKQLREHCLELHLSGHSSPHISSSLTLGFILLKFHLLK